MRSFIFSQTVGWEWCDWIWELWQQHVQESSGSVGAGWSDTWAGCDKESCICNSGWLLELSPCLQNHPECGSAVFSWAASGEPTLFFATELRKVSLDSGNILYLEQNGERCLNSCCIHICYLCPYKEAGWYHASGHTRDLTIFSDFADDACWPWHSWKLEARERGWSSWGVRIAMPLSTSHGVWQSAISSPVGSEAEPRLLKGFLAF